MSALPPVYGARADAINRRAVLAGIALLPAAAADTTIARAERALGGRALIDRVRALAWTGEAEVVLPGRTLVLRIETRIEPFVRARSTSWIKAEGRAAARTLAIEPDAGFVERDGTRRPLPAAMAAHERAQYGLYGHLLLKGALRAEGGAIVSTRPGFPEARLSLSPDGRVVSAAMSVPDAQDATKTIAEQVGLDGWAVTKGLAWPRRLAIRQNKRRYFTLVLDTFDVELS